MKVMLAMITLLVWEKVPVGASKLSDGKYRLSLYQCYANLIKNFIMQKCFVFILGIHFYVSQTPAYLAKNYLTRNRSWNSIYILLAV